MTAASRSLDGRRAVVTGAGGGIGAGCAAALAEAGANIVLIGRSRARLAESAAAVEAAGRAADCRECDVTDAAAVAEAFAALGVVDIVVNSAFDPFTAPAGTSPMVADVALAAISVSTSFFVATS